LLMQGLQTALAVIYPPRCLGCGGLVDEEFGLCGPCWRETLFIGGTVCDACGAPLLGPDLGDAAHCDECMDAPPPWARGRAAVLYQDMGRKLVLALKHGDRQEIARGAGRWMARAARDLVVEDMLVAPVPLHWRRLVARRYNQSALLGRSFAAALELPFCADLMLRQRHTASLEGKTRAERQETLRDAIRVHPKRRALVQGRPVLLVDDVMTTGATLSASARACLAAGSGPVSIATLARAVKAP
jgi:ComF family protein